MLNGDKKKKELDSEPQEQEQDVTFTEMSEKLNKKKKKKEPDSDVTLAEMSEKLRGGGKKKKKVQEIDVDVETRILKADIAKANKLTAQLEKSLLKAKSQTRKGGKKKAISFLDLGSSTTGESESKSASEPLPSIAALKKKLAANEPQF